MSGGDDKTIHDAFIGVARALDESPALVKGQENAVDGVGVDGTVRVGVPSRSISFGQLLAVCNAFASHLETREAKDVGIRTTGPPTTDERGAIIVGATAAVMLDSSDELMVAYFASLIAGKSFAPIETSLPPSSVEGLLESLRASANLTHLIVGEEVNASNSHKPMSLSFTSPRPPIRTFAIALRHDQHDDGECGSGVGERRRWNLSVSELTEVVPGMKPVKPLTLLGDASIAISFRGTPDDACHIIHTGGSTGRPKAVVCSHRGSMYSHAARTAALPYKTTVCSDLVNDDDAVDVTGVCVFGVWDAVCALLAGSRASMLPVGGVRVVPEAISLSAMSLSFVPSLALLRNLLLHNHHFVQQTLAMRRAPPYNEVRCLAEGRRWHGRWLRRELLARCSLPLSPRSYSLLTPHQRKQASEVWECLQRFESQFCAVNWRPHHSFDPY